MIAGAGGNIAVQTGELGEVLVDTGSENNADRVLAELRKLSKIPVRYIINTSAEPDHVGGNAEAGATTGLSLIPTAGALGAGVQNAVTNEVGGAAILATDNVMNRMSAHTGAEGALSGRPPGPLTPTPRTKRTSTSTVKGLPDVLAPRGAQRW